jgi:hypothetical protein
MKYVSSIKTFVFLTHCISDQVLEGGFPYEEAKEDNMTDSEDDNTAPQS